VRAERLGRLARMLEALPALWRGETVTDEELGLHDATLGPLGIDVPTVVIGGRSRVLLELAARHGDGWNAVVRSAPEFAELSERVDAIRAHTGRSRPIARTAQLFVPDLELPQAPQIVRDLKSAGANTVMFVLVQDHGPQALHALADAVLA
jgi:alkanesulfonate monooxygenase SsuD/methylene tetrahydromethanopterin reductase-like flavin-dependent oxidoreductase (luciferase family)